MNTTMLREQTQQVLGLVGRDMFSVNTTYAQTNLQLFNQLRRARYSDADIFYVCDVYNFALQIFAGRFRGSGKPFISHLIGTASILATLRVSVNVVAAGLLHAAYIYGEYATDQRGMTEAKHELVRRAVGVETEELIAGYTALKWNKQTIPIIRESIDTLEPKDRQILLIRLANELEDHLDLGILYCGNAENRREYIQSSLSQAISIATRLGFPSLAGALARVFNETLSVELPATGRSAQDHSFVLAAPKTVDRGTLSIVSCQAEKQVA